jgi:2-polyprenyl-3-methyl-5-hydroxy-6-metoxy-1,4-benzoquinol methylase
MDNEWDQYAQGWDDDPATRAYAAAAFGSLTELLQTSSRSLQGASVLDFGCGTGLLTEHLVASGATVEAVDSSIAMLDALTIKIDQGGWTTVRTSTQLPGPSRFDLVVCSSVCAFLDDYPATAADLVSRLGADGLFVQWDWERTDNDDHGLTRTQIHKALTCAGLTDVDVRTGFTIEVNGQAMAPLMGYGRYQVTPHPQDLSEPTQG